MTPNLQGIYGPSITCTTKTIRCSPHTSKVTEGIDFFTQKFSDLQADSSMSTSTNPTNNPSVEGLVHVSTNHFNGIEMTSASSAIEKNDDNTSTEKSLSKLSLGQRMTLETNPTSETATSSRGEEVNLGVQSVKPTFAILNQHENEDDGDDLDDDPDADLDL